MDASPTKRAEDAGASLHLFASLPIIVAQNGAVVEGFLKKILSDKK